VKKRQIIGEVGEVIRILGTDLTGATSLTFDGVAAADMKIASRTEIFAAIRVGATTGIVQVVTPSGTLSSNVLLSVLP
jgi:hypothetical protein